MRRARYVVLLLVCALAGALTAASLAGTTEDPPPPTETAPPGDAVIPAGVSVGGVIVGGLTVDAATSVVRAAFESPLTITVDGHVLVPSPESLGATGYVQNAVRRALTAAPDTAVPLVVAVQGAKVRAYVAQLAARFDREPVDARVVLRRLRPLVTRERPGQSVDRNRAVARIVRALRDTERLPIALPMDSLRPKITRRDAGSVVVIRRGSKWLYLYKGSRYLRRFRVATGMERYPTPLGRFRIVVKWKNPWWYPPDSDWAEGKEPIPPGPGNPLGTRWMGISAPGVGIHGTPDAASLGYSLSHGCIRMAISEAEWLFTKVDVGTTVFIVRA